MRTKLSAGRPLLWNRCETGSWAIPGRRSKRMPNVAAAGGRPAENGATPGSDWLSNDKNVSAHLPYFFAQRGLKGGRKSRAWLLKVD